MIGEWSASFDTLPVEKLADVMAGIKEDGKAPEFDRHISKERQSFLRHFVEAQMVTWESKDAGVSTAWFYWTMKMEGGAFAEWDFLRGVEEGWIPMIPPPSESSESLYGTCREIAQKTNDDMSIVHEFPDPKHLPENTWFGPDIDDDYVVSHAGSIGKTGGEEHAIPNKEEKIDDVATYDDDDTVEPATMPKQEDSPSAIREGNQKSWFPLFVICFVCVGVWHVFFKQDINFRPQRYQYTSLDTPTALSV